MTNRKRERHGQPARQSQRQRRWRDRASETFKQTDRDGERWGEGETETKTDSWWLGGRCGLRARETDRQTDIPNVLKFGTCNIAFD